MSAPVGYCCLGNDNAGRGQSVAFCEMRETTKLGVAEGHQLKKVEVRGKFGNKMVSAGPVAHFRRLLRHLTIGAGVDLAAMLRPFLY